MLINVTLLGNETKKVLIERFEESNILWSIGDLMELSTINIGD